MPVPYESGVEAPVVDGTAQSPSVKGESATETPVEEGPEGMKFQ